MTIEVNQGVVGDTAKLIMHRLRYPGRDHIGILGEMGSEYPGELIGIRIAVSSIVARHLSSPDVD